MRSTVFGETRPSTIRASSSFSMAPQACWGHSSDRRRRSLVGVQGEVARDVTTWRECGLLGAPATSRGIRTVSTTRAGSGCWVPRCPEG